MKRSRYEIQADETKKFLFHAFLSPCTYVNRTFSSPFPELYKYFERKTRRKRGKKRS